jgi:peptide/nickel transport system ATP-binding protein
LGDVVAVMYAGKIVEHGPADKVLGTPLHPYTTGLLKCRPRYGSSGRLASIEGVVPPATCWPEGCRFRSRCNYSDSSCQREPELQEVVPKHRTACWHWDKLGVNNVVNWEKERSQAKEGAVNGQADPA